MTYKNGEIKKNLRKSAEQKQPKREMSSICEKKSETKKQIRKQEWEIENQIKVGN